MFNIKELKDNIYSLTTGISLVETTGIGNAESIAINYLIDSLADLKDRGIETINLNDAIDELVNIREELRTQR